MSLVERVGVADEVCGEPYCTQPLARGATVPFESVAIMNQFIRAFKRRGPFRASEGGGTLWAAPKRSEAARETMSLLDRAAMRLSQLLSIRRDGIVVQRSERSLYMRIPNEEATLPKIAEVDMCREMWAILPPLTLYIPPDTTIRE
eukprot:7449835-Alexandrium_andersonii.AAC.1